MEIDIFTEFKIDVDVAQRLISMFDRMPELKNTEIHIVVESDLNCRDLNKVLDIVTHSPGKNEVNIIDQNILYHAIESAII